MSSVAFPFLVLPDEVVIQHEVLVGPAGRPLSPAGELLQHWDYGQDLEVVILISIDHWAAASALHLPAQELQLAAVVYAGTGPGSVPRQTTLVVEARVASNNDPIELNAVIPGHTLSGRLRLELQIVLAVDHHSSQALVPRLRGSRLWASRQDILLEDGGDSRFPIELTSFSKMLGSQGGSRSPWFVDWRPHELTADFAGTVRVYVNSDSELVAERFVAGDPPTLQAILGDVMSQMISRTLDHDDAEDVLDQCEEGSVGYQVRAWLDIMFPGQSLVTIRGLRQDRPGTFRASILAVADLGESA